MAIAFEFLRSLPLCGCFLLAGVVSCSQGPKKGATTAKAEVVKVYPHDADAFTQGLAFHNGVLYEGTGQRGRSTLRKVSIEDGKVLLAVSLDPRYFGEGVTILGKSIYQITWQEHTGFVYDLETMQYQRSFQFIQEGWGLTDDEENLIMSDGTAVIRFIDPNTFREIRKIQVKDGNTRIKNLNELEWVDGEIWANIWYEDRIARISPKDGTVLGWIDASHIYPQSGRDREAVMNGIAIDPESKRIFVTGKNWPNLFEIRLPERP